MIARDNERTIGAALESIRPHVGEMIVLDTGSKDRTPEIAASLGARVFHFPWCDDFSAARNESIRHARGQWNRIKPDKGSGVFFEDGTLVDRNGAAALLCV